MTDFKLRRMFGLTRKLRPAVYMETRFGAFVSHYIERMPYRLGLLGPMQYGTAVEPAIFAAPGRPNDEWHEQEYLCVGSIDKFGESRVYLNLLGARRMWVRGEPTLDDAKRAAHDHIKAHISERWTLRAIRLGWYTLGTLAGFGAGVLFMVTR